MAFGSFLGKLLQAVGAGVAAAAATGGNPFVGIAVGALQLGLSVLLEPKARKEVKEAKLTRSPRERGGDPVVAGQVVPVVYANRRINPYGGCYVEKHLISQWLEITQGSTKLHSLYAFSSGQAPNQDWGEIVEIDDYYFQINGNPKEYYKDSEIDIEFRAGTQNQPVFTDFRNLYSRLINPDSNNQFGLDRRTRISGNVTNTISTATNLIGVTNTPRSKLTKPPGTAGWNAGAFAAKPLRGNGFVQFSPQPDSPSGSSTTGVMAAGLSAQNLSTSNTAIQYGWQLNGAVAFPAENGLQVGAPVGYNADSLFVVRYDQVDGISYELDGVTVFNSTSIPAARLYPIFAINSINSGFDRVRTDDGQIKFGIDTGSSSFNVEDGDRIEPWQKYLFRTSCFGEVVQIQSKTDVNNIVTDGALTGAGNDTAIYSYADAYYATRSRVNRIGLNFAFRLYKRDKENELKNMGILFDIFIDTQPSTGEVFLTRVYAKAKNADTVYRQLWIRNLKLGNYRLRFVPYPCDPGGNTPIELLKENKFITVPGATIAGQQCQLYFDGIASAAINDLEWDQPQISTQESIPGRLMSVNEQVVLPAANLPKPRYRGLALMAVRLSDSAHLGDTIETSLFVSQARKIHGWIVGDRAAANGIGTVTLPAQSLAGVQPGFILRNLTTKTQGIVQSVAGNTVFSTTAMAFRAGDNVAIAFYLASNYFPDICCDFARNAFGGIPNAIDPDWEIDYPSMAESREFCRVNGYFFDDNISESIPFTQFLSRHCQASILLPHQPDGKYGMLPDVKRPIKYVFNQENSKNFKYSVDFANRPFNRVQVNWRDGEDLFSQENNKQYLRTTIAETRNLYNEQEYPYTEVLDYPSITKAAQASLVASRALKRYLYQQSAVDFEVSLSHAMRVKSNDHISFHHCSLNSARCFSGVVTASVGQNFYTDSLPGLTTIFQTGGVAYYTGVVSPQMAIFDSGNEYMGQVLTADGKTLTTDGNLKNGKRYEAIAVPVGGFSGYASWLNLDGTAADGLVAAPGAYVAGERIAWGVVGAAPAEGAIVNIVPLDFAQPYDRPNATPGNPTEFIVRSISWGQDSATINAVKYDNRMHKKDPDLVLWVRDEVVDDVDG
jgi:hypothetical protein